MTKGRAAWWLQPDQEVPNMEGKAGESPAAQNMLPFKSGGGKVRQEKQRPGGAKGAVSAESCLSHKGRGRRQLKREGLG